MACEYVDVRADNSIFNQTCENKLTSFSFFDKKNSIELNEGKLLTFLNVTSLAYVQKQNVFCK